MNLSHGAPEGILESPVELPQSDFYRDHQRAFSEAVGLPVTVHAPGTFQITEDAEGIPDFCRAMARGNRVCGTCCDEHRRLQDPTGETTRTMKCFAGMSSSAIPIRVAKRPAAYLHTGHVFLDEADEARQQRIERLLARRHGGSPEGSRRRARLFSEDQYQSRLKVLEVFAQRLGEEAEILAQRSPFPAVAQAMALIDAHFDQHWSLEKLAAHCHISPNYLSEMFRKTTGATFTDYLARVRTRNALAALRDPNRRISEIAFAMGFRSLSQFNRVFKQITGQSPRTLRLQTLRAAGTVAQG